MVRRDQSNLGYRVRNLWQTCERTQPKINCACGAAGGCGLNPFTARPRNDAMCPPAFDSEEVIRAEIFSVERLEKHATSLAAAQSVTARPVSVRPLTTRLHDNHRALLDAHRAIAKAIAQHSAITPSAEWLVDNFHVVEAQIRQIRDDLPPGYYRQLPKLADGPLCRLSTCAWIGMGLRRAYRQSL